MLAERGTRKGRYRSKVKKKKKIMFPEPDVICFHIAHGVGHTGRTRRSSRMREKTHSVFEIQNAFHLRPSLRICVHISHFELTFNCTCNIQVNKAMCFYRGGFLRPVHFPASSAFIKTWGQLFWITASSTTRRLFKVRTLSFCDFPKCFLQKFILITSRPHQVTQSLSLVSGGHCVHSRALLVY